MENFPEEVAFEQRSEWSEEASHANLEGRALQAEGRAIAKVLRNSKEASVAGRESEKERREGERADYKKSGFIPSVARRKPEVNHWGSPPMLCVLACEKSGQAHSKATLLSKTLKCVLLPSKRASCGNSVQDVVPKKYHQVATLGHVSNLQIIGMQSPGSQRGHPQPHLEGLKKHRSLSPTLRASDLQVWDGAQVWTSSRWCWYCWFLDHTVKTPGWSPETLKAGPSFQRWG